MRGERVKTTAYGEICGHVWLRRIIHVYGYYKRHLAADFTFPLPFSPALFIPPPPSHPRTHTHTHILSELIRVKCVYISGRRRVYVKHTRYGPGLWVLRYYTYTYLSLFLSYFSVTYSSLSLSSPPSLSPGFSGVILGGIYNIQVGNV